MSRRIRIGIVGCGPRGVHVGGLFARHTSFAVVALMDIFRAAAERAAQSLNVDSDRVYTDYDDFLRGAPLDAIFFACDPTVQVDLACRAMERGIHVCTEVPAALTLDECWRLVRTVEKSGCKYMLLEQMRYSGFVEIWRRMRERGEFGHICFAHGEYIHYERGWNYWIDPKTGENFRSPERPADRAVVPSWRMKVLAEPILYLPHTLSPILARFPSWRFEMRAVAQRGALGCGVGCFGAGRHGNIWPAGPVRIAR